MPPLVPNHSHFYIQEPHLNVRSSSMLPVPTHIERLESELGQSSSSGSGLFARVQIAPLVEGRLPIPANATHVMMEIGCSDVRTMDVSALPREPKGFLVSFEPLLDKYAILLARGPARVSARWRGGPRPPCAPRGQFVSCVI